MQAILEKTEKELRAEVEARDKQLLEAFADCLCRTKLFNRQLVSYQANKKLPLYRLYKFKEGFSEQLVCWFIENLPPPQSAPVLDPFAGSGTTLYAAAKLGYDSLGIEIMPVGKEIIELRKTINEGIFERHIARLEDWVVHKYWENDDDRGELLEPPITAGAYPEDTKRSIINFTGRLQSESLIVQKLLRFALLTALEDISYTRKDGQYLRWDGRSPRKTRSDKSIKEIAPFNEKITASIQNLIADVRNPDAVESELFAPIDGKQPKGSFKLLNASCLDELPGLASESYGMVFTSPPYCNRYDYTRTYALELAYLGLDKNAINALRQQLLSCTVENKRKDLIARNPAWSVPISICESIPLFDAIYNLFSLLKKNKQLNNNGITEMLRGYFIEMACVIFECYRTLKTGSRMVVVNDNVRYAGVNISVDLLLSEIAKRIGFEVESIYVLPSLKGNSSQQMGAFGREGLRKCIYVWKK